MCWGSWNCKEATDGQSLSCRRVSAMFAEARTPARAVARRCWRTSARACACAAAVRRHGACHGAAARRPARDLYRWDNYRSDRHASEMLAGQLQTTANCCRRCRSDTCCLTSISRQARSQLPAKMSTDRRHVACISCTSYWLYSSWNRRRRSEVSNWVCTPSVTCSGGRVLSSTN